MNLPFRVLLISAALLAAGCTLAPRYERPDTVVPMEVAPDTQLASDFGWRDFYRDEQLQALLEIALEENRDLRIAALSVEQVRAQYRIQRAQLLPSLSAQAGATRQRVPESLSATGASHVVEQYNVGVGIPSWELDLFGRVQSLKDQALEQYLASDAARKSVQMTLIAEVADGYFSWQSAQAQLVLAENTHVSREESYAMIQQRFDAGLASELALRQAESALHAARIDVSVFRQQVNQSFTTLEVLVGRSLDPTTLTARWVAADSLMDLPPNLSSDVLLLRPDVLQAEHQLRAANANIGAARAAFFPRITLTASYGFAGVETSGLTDSVNRAWSISPQLSVPLFAWGANSANLEVSKLQKDINVARYQQVLQVAFKEVHDQLQARVTLDDQLDARVDLNRASQRSLELAERRYEGGVDSYLEVLDAQRNSNAAQQALINTHLAQLRNQLTLYKALGGGLLEKQSINAITARASVSEQGLSRSPRK